MITRLFLLLIISIFAHTIFAFVIPSQDTTVCIQVIVWAKDPVTGVWKEFPTPCDVPQGWEISYSRPESSQTLYQCAEFIPEEKLLKISSLKVASSSYRVDFSFVPSTASFTIKEASPLAQEEYSWSEYDPEKKIIEIPCVKVTQKFFQVTLEQTTNLSSFNLQKVKEIKIIPFSEEDNGRRIDVQIGDLLIISLKENFDGGYSWQIKQMDNKFLKLINSYTKRPDFYINMPQPIIGGYVNRIFVFQTISEGRTTIELTEQRPWIEESINSFSLDVNITP